MSDVSTGSATAGRILAAASRALRVNDAASMEDIAAEAGVSRATVHRHFASRDVLVAEAVAWATNEVEQVFTATRRPSEPIVVRLYDITRTLLETKSALDAILHSQTGDVQELERSGVFTGARGLIDELIESGQLAATADARWAAHAYLGLLRIAAHEGRSDDDEIDRLTATVLDTFLHGVGATGLRYSV